MVHNITSKLPPQKSIVAMLTVTPVQAEPMCQLETMLDKHTGMYNDNILPAIQNSKKAMKAQLEVIQVETGVFCTYHAKLVEHVDETE
ncbi:hypothetical protein NDU88_003818 [Pleurodeles waltl]|uniref:Uncharacterized protein n=1 Tax=Pleurodeles waltl TaxID=8319 RepID=A0AAV7W3E6_PLEWA|nr:hypothetical protein NDU88_003818 [Pleurodeles waltl]